MKRAAFQILLFSIVTAGPCSNGWCDGYGTVRYYDPNGYYISAYVGHVSHGFYRGDFVVDSLLSGGIHRHCEVVKGLFSPDGDMQEVRFRVTCDGQVIHDNHYDCTLVIYNKPPYIDMVNMNPNAEGWITLNLIRYANEIYNWIRAQSRDRQQ